MMNWVGYFSDFQTFTAPFHLLTEPPTGLRLHFVSANQPCVVQCTPKNWPYCFEVTIEIIGIRWQHDTRPSDSNLSKSLFNLHKSVRYRIGCFATSRLFHSSDLLGKLAL